MLSSGLIDCPLISDSLVVSRWCQCHNILYWTPATKMELNLLPNGEVCNLFLHFTFRVKQLISRSNFCYSKHFWCENNCFCSVVGILQFQSSNGDTNRHRFRDTSSSQNRESRIQQPRWGWGGYSSWGGPDSLRQDDWWWWRQLW